MGSDGAMYAVGKDGRDSVGAGVQVVVVMASCLVYDSMDIFLNACDAIAMLSYAIILGTL